MSDDGSHNLNRAICNAAGDAEKAEQDDNMTRRDDQMQAIFLKNYVKVNLIHRAV